MKSHTASALRLLSLVVTSAALVACGSSGNNISTSTGSGGEGTGGSAGMAGAGGMGTGGMGTGGSGGSMIAGCPGLDPINEPAEVLYVAPNGNDMAMGTKDAPLATLGAAAKLFPNGGTIIVRAGVYPHQVVTNAKGTADHPLVIRAEMGETPIFDGAAQTQDYRGTIHLTNATNVVLMGLEVRNGTGSKYASGISNGGSLLNLRVRDCHLHDINGPVMRFKGDGIILENNHIHDGALMNSVDHSQGWPTCMGTQPDQQNPTNPWTKNVTIRNNHIHDCWGEGIGLFFGTNAIVEGNIVERTWNVGIYLDNASDVDVSRNFVHMIDGMANNPGPGSPILIGMENYDFWGVSYQPTLNVDIVNNIAIGRRGVGWFDEPNTSPNIYFDNLTIAHNTFVSTADAIRIGTVQAGQPLPKKISINNNAIIEAKPSDVSTMFPDAFKLGGNAWINEALPSIAKGTTDVSIMSVSLPANPMTATDYQSLAAIVGSAESSANVPMDYLCAPRSSTTPTRGAFEK